MQTNPIPNGLILETNPAVTRLFPSVDSVRTVQPSFSFMPQFQTTSLRSKELEETGMLVRYKRKEREKVFDDNGNVNPQPNCPWGNTHLARFINRYVSWVKKKPSEERTLFIKQLEDIAKENNVKLPLASEITKRKKMPVKRLVAEAIDINRYCDVMKLKVYYNGTDFVGYIPGENKAAIREVHEQTKWDVLFDTLYPQIKAMPENNERGKTLEEKRDIRNRIEYELVKQFYELYDYDDKTEKEPCPLFIQRKLYNKSASYNERKKRFFRKKDQVRWTAWITITYSDKKFKSEEDFYRALKKYFNNKSAPDRGNWLVMGKFEHGELNGRLHFHGFFYIPQGTVSRKLVDRKKYSDKDKKWHNYKADKALLETFGDNEYEDLTDATQNDIHAMAKYTDKMTRYMDKGGKVFYSRHIPMDYELDVMGKEIFTRMTTIHKRAITRYVLWDDEFIRSDIQILRKNPIATHEDKQDESDPYDIGLLDEAA